MYKAFEGDKVVAIGWDASLIFNYSSELQNLTLNVMNKSSCESTLGNEITQRQFCMNSLKDENLCKIGRGGSVLYPSVTDNNQYIPYLIGITSYGLDCFGPTVNSKITKLLNWIVSETPHANYCKNSDTQMASTTPQLATRSSANMAGLTYNIYFYIYVIYVIVRMR